MISRLSASAAAFAILVTASIAVAAGPAKRAEAPQAASGATMPVIQFEPVVVIGRRSSAPQR